MSLEQQHHIISAIKYEDPARTIAVFGAARGGTTAVAGLVRKLGVNMGRNLPVNLEDPDFNLHALKKRGVSAQGDVIRTIGEAIKSRDRADEVWGWKFPDAASYLREVHSLIRNPVYVVVFRDLAAVSARAIRRGEDAVEAMTRYSRAYKRNLDVIRDNSCPTACLSYESIMSNPVKSANFLADFLGYTRPDEGSVVSFLTPGYKEVNATNSDVQ